MAAKQKYYVVWQGHETGIFTSWGECWEQVKGFPAAAYRSYPTREEAEAAYAQPYDPHERQKEQPAPAPAPRGWSVGSGLPPAPPTDRHDTVLPLPPEVTANAWAVDAACSHNPGPMEYRGVDLATGAVIFHFGPLHGTNNIGEFLAIVHALALLDQRHEQRTIYSDSRIALSWVRQRTCKTRLPRTPQNEHLLALVARAEQWLRTHPHSHIPLLKWQTERWGEIPADFGRKGK